MNIEELKVGDRIKDNDPRMSDRILTITETTEMRVKASRNGAGLWPVWILKNRIYTDGKPRRGGFDLVRAEQVKEMTMDEPDLTVAQKRAANVWDHVDDALAVIDLARAGKWSWCENYDCKYIELRIDMRDGGCLIRDRNGNRINPADLRKQISGHMHGDPWPKERAPLTLGEWQKEAIRDAATK